MPYGVRRSTLKLATLAACWNATATVPAQTPSATAPAATRPVPLLLRAADAARAAEAEARIESQRIVGRFASAAAEVATLLTLLRAELGDDHWRTQNAGRACASLRTAALFPPWQRLVRIKAERLRQSARALLDDQKPREAAEAHAAAAACFDAAAAPHDAAMARGFAGGASILALQLDRAAGLLAAAEAQLSALGDTGNAAIFAAFQGRQCLFRNQPAAAAEHYARAAAGHALVRDTINANVAHREFVVARDTDLWNRMLLARAAARFDEAVGLARELRAHRERVNGPERVLTQLIRAELTIMERAAAAPVEQQKACARIFEKFDAALRATQMGQWATAVTGFQRAAAAAAEADEPLMAARAEVNAAVSRIGLGRFADAETRLTAALERLQPLAFDPALAVAAEERARCRVAQRKLDPAIEDLRVALAAYERMGEPIAAGNIHFAIGDCQLALQRERDAVDAFLAAARSFLRETDVTIYQRGVACADRDELIATARELVSAGKSAEAEHMIHAALARATVQSDAATAVALVDQLRLLNVQRGDRVRELRCVAEAIRLYRSLMDAQGLHFGYSLGFMLQALGQRLYHDGRFDEALPFYEDALRAFEAARCEDDAAHAREQIGDALRRLNRDGEAADAYARAEAAWAAIAGPNSPVHIRALERLAYNWQGDDDAAARRYLQRAATVRRAGGASETDSVEFAEHLAQTAGIAAAVNLPRDARDYGERARAMFERLELGDSDMHALALVAAGLGHALCANTTLALDRVDRALPMLRRLGMEEGQLLSALNVCGLALLMAGRPAEALERLDRMLEVQRLARLDQTSDYAVGLVVSGAALGLLGEHDAAEERYGQALAVPGLPLVQKTALQFSISAFRAQVRDDAGSMSDLFAAAGNLNALAPAGGAVAGSAYAVQATREFLAGDFAAALRSIDEALKSAPDLAQDSPALLAMMQLIKAETLLKVDRAAEVPGLLDAARPELEQTGSPLYVAALRRVAGLHLLHVGRIDDAIRVLEEAVTLVEQLRGSNAAASEAARAELARVLFLNRAYEAMVKAQLAAGRPAEALRFVERGRARGLLDLLERSRFDPLAELRDRARLQRDAALLRRIDEIEHAREAARLAVAHLEHEIALRRGIPADGDAGRSARQADLDRLYEAQRAARAREQAANRDWFALVSNDLPLSQTRDAAEIQQLLAPGEVLLVYLFTAEDGLLFLVPPPGGEVRTATLRWPDGAPVTDATLRNAVDEYLRALLRAGENARGLTRADRSTTAAGDCVRLGARLMRALVPPDVWSAVQHAPRLYVVPHGALHRIPFETLVVNSDPAATASATQPAAAAQYWLDAGPPIVYGSSGSALLRARARRNQQRNTRGAAPPFAAVAIGDPIFSRGPEQPATAASPAAGALVLAVPPAAAATGLLRGDIITRYDGHPIATHIDLRNATRATQDAVEDGARPATQIEMSIWRAGSEHTLHVEPGELGVRVARDARADALATAADRPGGSLPGVERGSPVERYGGLAALPGTRAEVASIYLTLTGAPLTADRLAAAPDRSDDASDTPRVCPLLGERATESAVYTLAPQARFLHFATHQLADETQSASYSSLALTLPPAPSPLDNGFLTLQELLDGWRDRLNACELVVLSACETQRGREQHDDAVFAMPIGFQYAGAPSVIASLWRVNDASTAELMADFYARLPGAPDDKLAAFTAARRALRERYPEPYFWAPFIYIGDPR